MRMGDYVVYRIRNTVRVGKWVSINKKHRAIIKSLEKGNETYITRNMNLILSLDDLFVKYGLKTPEKAVKARKMGRPKSTYLSIEERL